MLIIFIVIVVLLVIYLISVQRKFVGLEEMTENALSQIGVQQMSRWDALTQLVKAVKGYAEHEYDLLMETVKLRGQAKAPDNPGDVEANDAAFRETYSKLSLVAENYPDLKSAPVFQDLMDSVNNYEDKVRMSRMVYNDTVTKWNRLTREFPTNLVASIFGFRKKDYLQTPEEKKELPEMEF